MSFSSKSAVATCPESRVPSPEDPPSPTPRDRRDIRRRSYSRARRDSGRDCPIEALRVKADGHDRHSFITASQLLYFPGNSILKPIERGAADAGAPQSDSPWN